MSAADGVDHEAQPLGGVVGQDREAGVVHEVVGIHGGDLGTGVGGFDDHVAGQDEAGGGVDLERLVGEGRVAGAEDLERWAVDVELRLEGGGDVDLGETPKPWVASASRTAVSASAGDRSVVVSMACMWGCPPVSLW